MRWTFFPHIHLYNLHSTGFHSVRHLNRKIIKYFQNLYAIEERWETNQNHLKNVHRIVEIDLSSLLICQIASGKGKSTGQHYKLHSHVTHFYLDKEQINILMHRNPDVGIENQIISSAGIHNMHPPTKLFKSLKKLWTQCIPMHRVTLKQLIKRLEYCIYFSFIILLFGFHLHSLLLSEWGW